MENIVLGIIDRSDITSQRTGGADVVISDAAATGSILGLRTQPQTPDALTLEVQSTPPPRSRIRVLWKWSLAVTAVIVAYFGWQIGSTFISGETSANSAISNFHWLLNRGYYQDIIEDTDEGFRKGWTNEELVRFFSQVHNKLGEARDTSSSYLNVTATPTVTLFTVRCNTRFEKGEAVETFTWIKSGDKLKLHGYNVSSKNLRLELSASPTSSASASQCRGWGRSLPERMRLPLQRDTPSRDAIAEFDKEASAG